MSNPNIAHPSYAAAAVFGRLLMGAIFVWSGIGKLLAAAPNTTARWWKRRWKVLLGLEAWVLQQ